MTTLEPSQNRRTSPACLVPLAAIVLAVAACGTGPVDQFNNPAEITSVGPVSFDGTSVLIDYTLRDQEGDDQSLSVGICTADDGSTNDCPIPVAGTGGDGTSLVPTVPRGTDVPHRLSWNVGCGRIDGDSCIETEFSTEYVAKLKVEGTDATVTSEAFSLEGLSADAVPDCDLSAGEIPEPCDPRDSGNEP